MRLKDTVVLVTGGAKRVGRALSLAFARGGCDVAVHYRASQQQAEQVVQEIRDMGQHAVAVRGELGESADWPQIIQRTVDQLGRLDVLVNNAAEFLGETADTIDGFDPGLWDRMLRVNLLAPMGLAHYARPHLEAGGQGKIINLCDISSDRPWPDHLAYCCSKAALSALTKGLARALAPGIQVNGVAPGIAVFPDQYSEELRSRLIRQVPLGRAGTPEELARFVRALIESGDYITGEIVRFDGGRSLR